jgi:hypothetical protein
MPFRIEWKKSTCKHLRRLPRVFASSPSCISLKSSAGSARALACGGGRLVRRVNIRLRTLGARVVVRSSPDREARSGTRAGACAPRKTEAYPNRVHFSQ